MPGHNATRMNKNRGHLSNAAAMKNQKMINIALGIEPPDKYHKLSFARITANRQQYFSLRVLHDGKPLEEAVQGSPCGTFLARGKVRMRMTAGDVVLVEGLESLPAALAREKKLTVEITARLSKKQAQQAYRAGLLPKVIYKEPEDDDDDLFDYDSDYSDEDGDEEGDEEGEGEVTAKKKFGKVQKVKKAPTAGMSGRGSGGKKDYGGTGGGGGAKTATAGHKAVKDQLDAIRYASGTLASELAADDESPAHFDFDRSERPEKAAEAPAAPAPAKTDKESGTQFSLFSAGAAAHGSYEDDDFGTGGGAAAYERPYQPVKQKKVKDCWEDDDGESDDELNIDDI